MPRVLAEFFVGKNIEERNECLLNENNLEKTLLFVIEPLASVYAIGVTRDIGKERCDFFVAS